MDDNDFLPLPSLLRLIAARADGDIAGPTVDAKIAELTARCQAEGLILAVLSTD